jgi:hypothetical protein
MFGESSALMKYVILKCFAFVLQAGEIIEPYVKIRIVGHPQVKYSTLYRYAQARNNKKYKRIDLFAVLGHYGGVSRVDGMGGCSDQFRRR